MELGCFSISLSVRDLSSSQQFYEKLGFRIYAGEIASGFLIMQNGNTNIGLFQAMFEGNMLTFNPGWDQQAKALDTFTDVRELRDTLQAKGLKITQQQLEQANGPGSFTVSDPDGNMILFDQHR